ncbi:hypothetical protein FMEXI_1281 [Fusarium mexicanum]|uniref:Integral membrane protein n=1 Tax=Fusarium mexicanum TaxID=751941 RepID=A0A8H5N8Z5_9HYPO|nr:hypothetical protein FMEXI_1281 [Fusarium mexicanum]
MRGFLVPDHFVADVPGEDEMNLASVVWGISLGITIFTCAKAFQQARSLFRRRRRLNAYAVFVWLEILSSVVMGVIIWLYFRQVVGPSFQYFFSVSICWTVQVQCLIQIITNRVGVLMVSRSQATKLKWVCFIILGLVNISVIVIWVPARLQINQRFVDINKVWDRVEKIIFAVMDAALNFYFIYIVKIHLVAGGLAKYNLLYKVNLALVVISISMDILLVCVMSLPYDFFYAQFHPVVYLLKLHIEMNMADLITKVVRAKKGNCLDSYNHASHSAKNNSRSHHNQISTILARPRSRSGEEDEVELNDRGSRDGIQKTVVTKVVVSGAHEMEDDDVPEHHERAVSETGSSKLQKPYGVEQSW